MKYEYIVAFEQQGKITFVNGEWVNPLQGREPSQDDVQRCPDPHDFLNAKGAEEWDLVSVLLYTGDQQLKHYYLRREIVSKNG